MQHYRFGVQKHNFDKNYLPLRRALLGKPHEMFDLSEKGLDANKVFLGSWNDAQSFLILSIGKPREHFLWWTFEVKKDRLKSKGELLGPGWILNPPVRLCGPDWDEFQKATKNNIGLGQIDSLPYASTLMQVSQEHFRPGVFDAQTIGFLTEIAELAMDDPQFDQFAKAVVTEAAKSLTDLPAVSKALDAVGQLIEKLRALGWAGSWMRPYQKAERLLRSRLTVPAKADAVPSTAAVSPAEFDDLRRRLAEIAVRERQDVFRSELVAAYGGRCAITGTRGIVVLEAAHIRPYSGPLSSTVDNGLLLRSDIHRLFDRHLIAIDPETGRVGVSKLLRPSDYYGLRSGKLRMPKLKEHRPNLDALWERWQQFCMLEETRSDELV
jgi:hypothetical protein